MGNLFDPLFHVPWATGFFLALLLPLLGSYLRMREEWLAALGLAQMSAAAGLIGFGFGIPIFVAGPLGGAIMALIKTLSRASNTAYALMILCGWAVTFLVAANTPLGESLGHSLIDGQIYFVQNAQCIATFIVLLISLPCLRWMSAYLLRAKLFPHYEKLNEQNAFRWHMGFDLLVAVSMGIATASVGLVTAFAMVFIPPWVAFSLAQNWRAALLIAIGFNLAAYTIGFAFALLIDQPYGPLQVAIHLLLGLGILGFSRLNLAGSK